MASPGKRTSGAGGVSDSFDATGGTQMGTQTQSGITPLTSHGIWVAVRVRPFNKRELQESQTSGEMGEAMTTVELERNRKTITLLDPSKGYKERGNYQFDYCFSAFRPSIEFDTGKGDSESDDDEEVVAEKAQSEVYQCLGQPIVASAWQGYNGCIFAYGQTSSGKTYTMMGTKRDPGVIPRLCRELFEKIEDDEATKKMQSELSASGDAAASTTKPQNRKITKVSVSYMEIYNEQVKDLLKVRTKGAKPKFNSRFDSKDADGDYEDLRVRQHPLHGPFVEGLTKTDVHNWLDCVRIIRQGNELRSTTGTAMNDTSSRSHAIFQIVLTQTESLGARVRGKEVTNHRVSKINLVDLAGSERITKSNVTGKHVTEANFINKSLSTLRKVIDVLVTTAKKKSGGAPVVVPYRESLLTWILSDNFGGNSKTAMIANVSPHFSCWLETEGTLRYATLAKGIVNRIRVNEDASAKLIRELQSQLKALQSEMANGPQQGRVRELEEQMEENKRAMEELLAREEGMRKLIQESRSREAKLRAENESLEAAHSHWKQEAERLEREKEELRSQLTRLAEDGKVAPNAIPKERKNSGSAATFWATEEGEAGSENTASATSPTDDSSCPPQSHRPQRPSSANIVVATSSDVDRKEKKGNGPAFLDDDVDDDDAKKDPLGSPIEKESDMKDRSTSNQELPVLAGGSASSMNLPPVTPPNDQHDGPGHDLSVSPSVRYGRRAVTEEGKERESSQKPAVRTAEQRPRPNRGNLDSVTPNQQGTPSGVPMSLQHLVGPSPTSSASTSPAFQNKAPAGSDALDAFLSGGTDDSRSSVAERKKERAVPPWRRKR